MNNKLSTEGVIVRLVCLLFFIGGLLTLNFLMTALGWILLILMWIGEGKFKVEK